MKRKCLLLKATMAADFIKVNPDHVLHCLLITAGRQKGCIFPKAYFPTKNPKVYFLIAYCKCVFSKLVFSKRVFSKSEFSKNHFSDVARCISHISNLAQLLVGKELIGWQICYPKSKPKTKRRQITFPLIKLNMNPLLVSAFPKQAN